MMPMAYAAPAAPMMLKSKKKMATMNVEERSRSARIVGNQFKPVDLTKEMGETYYYDRDDFRKYGHFDEANLFWLDLAQWDESKGSFLSQVSFSFRLFNVEPQKNVRRVLVNSLADINTSSL